MLCTSEGIVPQFLRMMTALTNTSSPELLHSLNPRLCKSWDCPSQLNKKLEMYENMLKSVQNDILVPLTLFLPACSAGRNRVKRKSHSIRIGKKGFIPMQAENHNIAQQFCGYGPNWFMYKCLSPKKICTYVFWQIYQRGLNIQR